MATVIKLKRSSTADSVPTTSDLADGEVAINIADQKIYVNNSGTIVEVANAEGSAGAPGSFTTLTTSGDVTLNSDVTLGDATGDDITVTGRIASHLIPKTNDTYDLGTSSLRWRTAYLAASTLDLGGATISSDGTGTISIAAAGATLPTGSLVGTDLISSANTVTGVPIRNIPFYTNAGGSVTPATTFVFKGSGADDVEFEQFYFSNGTNIMDGQTVAQFVF